MTNQNPQPKSARTEAQKAASRANGAKSRGPVSEEGKQRSSLNAFKHGRYAVDTVLRAFAGSDLHHRLLARHGFEFRPGALHAAAAALGNVPEFAKFTFAREPSLQGIDSKRLVTMSGPEKRGERI